MTFSEVDSLIARADGLTPEDHDAAVYLTRDAHVLARKLFGEQSPHVAELNRISFRPLDGIYNTGHYLNAAAWKDGSRGLQAILKSMRYELSLSKRPELQPPETVTLPWLFHHLSWKMWLSFLSVIAIVFSAGFFAGHVKLFVQIYNLVTKGTPP
jgi:hypothetical protein